MKIVRCLWGNENHQFKDKDLKFYHDECCVAKLNDSQFKLENQIVFVWDGVNRELMETLNYPYYYMGESSVLEPELNFLYKIFALKKSMEEYDEILFLDWDFFITKELDDQFFNLLQNREDIQMPLYFYPKEMVDLFKVMDLENKIISNYYNNLHTQLMTHCKWEFEEGLVIPNAGFIYCRNKEFFNDILEIQKKNDIKTNIEEISAMVYFHKKMKNIDEYLETIEPIVCNGREDDDMWGKQLLFNRYTMDVLNKNIYFKHK